MHSINYYYYRTRILDTKLHTEHYIISAILNSPSYYIERKLYKLHTWGFEVYHIAIPVITKNHTEDISRHVIANDGWSSREESEAQANDQVSPC